MEIIDLYDKDRKPLNKTAIKYNPLKSGEYQIIVHTCLFNDLGQMLIQKRGLDKIDWPNKWDISSGGGVMSGETSPNAAQRELYEELGVKTNLENERPYFTVHYPKGFDDYYLVDCSLDINDFTYDGNEVIDIKWASLSEIKNMIKNDEFIKYNEGFIDLLFSMKNNRGTYPKGE